MPRRLGLLVMVWIAGVAAALGSDAVVLKGGERIELKEPPVQKGNNALLTRADGTLFSVPMSEVDWKATGALKNAKAQPSTPVIVAPPSLPSEAVRTGRQEKARVRVTDADVGHQAEPEAPAAGPGEKKPSQMPASMGRVEVLEYTQVKNGDNLIVTGQLHNPGVQMTSNVRLAVTATAADFKPIATAAATLSNGTIEPGKAVSFSASLPVGDRAVAVVRFSPQWWSAAPAPVSAPPANGNGVSPAASSTAPDGGSAPAAAGAPAAGSASGSKPPAPATTPLPYGQGLFYAGPAPSAPSEPPADGKTGYLPGASSPDNQPKPPQ